MLAEEDARGGAPAADEGSAPTTTTSAPPSPVAASRTRRTRTAPVDEDSPSMTLSFFVYWILPLLVLAACSRYGVDTSVGHLPTDPHIPMPPRPNKPRPANPASSPPHVAAPTTADRTWAVPTQSWPTAYRTTVDRIAQRRSQWTHGPPQQEPTQTTSTTSTTTSVSSSSPSSSTATNDRSPSSSTSTGAASDPRKQQVLEKLEQLRRAYEAHPRDLLGAIAYADAMRFYETQFHDGGTFEEVTIALYRKIIGQVTQQRQEAQAAGQATRSAAVPDELIVDYKDKSLDGILCALYTSLGKLYFMANMFERSAEAYTSCIDGIEAGYLDAVNGRASTGIVLGQYEAAGADYLQVIQSDEQRYFTDAFTGIARILEANESAVPGGWDSVLAALYPLLHQYTEFVKSRPDGQAGQVATTSLNRLHHTLFTYHDRKTKDYAQAWSQLQQAHQLKLAGLPPWNKGMEQAKVQQIEHIFTPDFWPPGVGSATETPIFIIGFPRSGSTLLERVLDAHPQIVGTGENSVFNGRLDDIRNQIVQISVANQQDELGPLTQRLADQVVAEMYQRWERLRASTVGLQEAEPLRLVDKMLTNYYNVGFIHMLYPNALILHVMREPMDTLFSAFKHEFPTGTLAYTSQMQALTEMYAAYRQVMLHWDEVLPGRVTHVRYEDMVHDMPGVARAVIDATGLEWDEGVLDFHKKKHYVNTMSSTQVRKGVYKEGLKSWMRYEQELQPLVKLVGAMVQSDIETTLPAYQKPEGGHVEL